MYLVLDQISSLQGVVLSICLIFTYLIWSRVSSPLNKIPGPFLSSLTNLWLVRKTRGRQRHLSDVELHQKYGSVVRIGPTEVSLSSPAAVKAVYGNVNGKSLKKGDWYTLISPPSKEGFDLLSEPDIHKFRLQRRQIGPLYTASSISDVEPSLDSIFARNLASMRERSGDVVDLDDWSHMFALDCLTSAVFSTSTEQVIAGTDDGTIASIKKGWEYSHWATRFPLLHRLNAIFLKFTGRDIWGNLRPQSPKIFDWAIFQLDKIMSAYPLSTPKPHPNLAMKLLSLHQTNPLFTERHLTDSTGMHFGAGLETLGITLAAFLCNIIQRPRLKARIQKELDDAAREQAIEFSSEGVPKTGEIKQRLRLFEASLRESMRLNPVIGVSFPRIVGPEGLLTDGVLIPSGTTVGVNPWVVGRSQELYGLDAENFRPERWLEMGKEERIRIDTYDQTFGLGAHKCPGMHLAQTILHKTLLMFLMHFDWEFEDSNVERQSECMFGVRWKDVNIFWKERVQERCD